MLGLRAEEIRPGGAPLPARLNVHVHQIDLIDADLIAFEPVGRDVGPDRERQHHGREREPGEFHAAEDFAEQEVVHRAD